jgi:hypothetical protein
MKTKGAIEVLCFVEIKTHMTPLLQRDSYRAGCLDELRTERGINVEKYRSFELYRRNTSRPEILTFDELYYRAKFIVEHIESC